MVTLQKIGSHNIWKVVRLSVSDAQKDFVATNTESILEAYAATQDGYTALPFALYDDDLLIGFVLFGYGSIGDEDEPSVAADNYCIWRLMIDQRYQGKGCGKAALAASLAYLKTAPCGAARACWLSYEPQNIAAKALYAAAGFVENGETDGDELVAVRPF